MDIPQPPTFRPSKMACCNICPCPHLLIHAAMAMQLILNFPTITLQICGMYMTNGVT